MESIAHAFDTAREQFGRAARDFFLEALCDDEVAEVLREALALAGVPPQRRSPLQPLFVTWFQLGRALYPADSLQALLARLLHALRGRIPVLSLREVSDSALCHARERVGIQPFVHLLRLVAAATPAAPRFHGWRPLGLDGTHLDVPDTPSNRAAFGRPCSAQGTSSWPQVLLLVLVDLGTRAAREALVAPCHASEKVVGRALLPRVGAGDLLVLDAGFYGIPFLSAVQERGAAFLCPVPCHVKLPLQGRVRVDRGVYDYRSLLHRRERPRRGAGCTVSMEVRVLQGRDRDGQWRRLVTNLPDTIPARDIFDLYERRWQAEMAFDEIKTVLCHTPAGAQPSHLRSKGPELVVQEAFALLCTHALIRRTMAVAATATGQDALDLSFTDSTRILRLAVPQMLAAPAARLPGLYDQLLGDIARQTLRRPEMPRWCPRQVRRKGPKYPLRKTLTPRVA